MDIHQAREIISEPDARELLQEHKIEIDGNDPRTASEYMAEVLVCLEAGITAPLRAYTPIDAINRRTGDPAQDRTPYFA